jgi:hypothetical protein
MSEATKSGKVNRLLADATLHNLEVAIHDDSNQNRDTYRINISVKGRHELPTYSLARGQIFIYASRYTVGGSAKAFRIHGTYITFTGKQITLKPSEIGSYIRVLAQFASEEKVAA